MEHNLANLPKLFKEAPIHINLKNLLERQRRQANEVDQPECR